MRLSTRSLRAANRFASLACCLLSSQHVAPVYSEFRNSSQITEEISALQDRVEAIRQDCIENNRDMTDEEVSECDSIMGSGDPGQSGYIQGKIGRLQANLERIKRIEANQAAIALARASSNNPLLNGASSLDSPAGSKIVVPANCMTFKTPEAFKGPTAIEDAYKAGRFYLAALFGHKASEKWCAEHGITVQAAQSGGVDTKGGFLVPSELSQTILKLAYEYGRVLEYADIYQMSTDTLDITKEVGDPEASWMGANGAASEGATVPSLDFDYASYKLIANKLGALTKISSELSEDAIIDIADTITVRLARACAKQLDRTGFLGTGNAASGGFTGILPALAAGSKFIPPNGTLSYGAFTKAMFDQIIGRVEEYADQDRCAWFVNKKFYTLCMAPIKEAIGGNTGMDLTEGAARRREMFLGYPVVYCSIFPKTQAAIPANTWLGGFGDLKASLLVGLRREVQIAISTEAFFSTDETGIRLLMRGSIQAHDIGDATNGGAFIGITTAAG